VWHTEILLLYILLVLLTRNYADEDGNSTAKTLMTNVSCELGSRDILFKYTIHQHDPNRTVFITATQLINTFLVMKALSAKFC